MREKKKERRRRERMKARDEWRGGRGRELEGLIYKKKGRQEEHQNELYCIMFVQV